MAVVLQHELVLQVLSPHGGASSCHPGVTSFNTVEVFLSTLDGCIILAPGGTISVAVEAHIAFFLCFPINGVQVRGDDGDLAPIDRPVAVGWEGDKFHLELLIWP
jgi:hypothetical protein